MRCFVPSRQVAELQSVAAVFWECEMQWLQLLCRSGSLVRVTKRKLSGCFSESAVLRMTQNNTLFLVLSPWFNVLGRRI